MGGGGSERTLEFSVSSHFWRLATKAIQIRSNETFRFVTLPELISDMIGTAARAHCGTAILRNHFKQIPSSGSIVLTVTLDQAVVDELDALARSLANQLDDEMRIADAISFLCFNSIGDYYASLVLRTPTAEDDS